VSLKIGDPVWYYPRPYSENKRYAAVIDGDVRELGGERVVRLRDLERQYAIDCHGGSERTTVAAAALFAVAERYADDHLRAARGKERE
jgi:hypothetical protein